MKIYFVVSSGLPFWSAHLTCGFIWFIFYFSRFDSHHELVFLRILYKKLLLCDICCHKFFQWKLAVFIKVVVYEFEGDNSNCNVILIQY